MSTRDVIDAAAHPFPVSDDVIRKHMRAPLSHLRFPGLDGYFYPSPVEEYDTALAPESGPPGADPSRLHADLVEQRGFAAVILLPITRGVLPDLDMSSEICTATNTWLAEEWLPVDTERFFGSIRVNPGDSDRAIAEIERWAGHPQMVQVAVPLQAHQPYGQRRFRALWECTAANGLPVAVHADALGGNEYWPTSTGYPTTYVEYAAQYPINYVVHLISLIAEGVFEDVEDLKFVFADGGIDMLHPILWRLDADWRPLRSVTPWVKRPPLEYLDTHVRFCSQALEGPTDESLLTEWLESARADTLLMYSSNYPSSAMHDHDALASLPDELASRVLYGNAVETYPKLAAKLQHAVQR
jgi:predicted TIM-barrel fold metal-dependent hydrolase